ncbi:hypothetical protein BVX97_05500 [bacterium E08(2017)]|nr:hypothetical protein BVX97_05500 [bacterium E08(2017)]
MKKTLISALILIVAATAVHAGPKWEFGEDSWMQVGFLGQAHGSFPDNAEYDQDFYLRRARIMVYGQISDGIKFFAETDNDKAGKKGADVSTDIQDAFIDIRLLQNDSCEVWTEAGLILLPFAFEVKSSAASLLGLDYNAEAIKLANTFVWRDNGAEIRAKILNKIDIRVGAFDGYDAEGSSKSDAAGMRYTGHIGVNLIGEASTGWFLGQNGLGKKNFLAIGAGFDQQDKATALMTTDAVTGVATETGQQDSSAWVVDFMSSFKLCSKSSLLVNGAYYDWDNASFEGNTAFVETGIIADNTMLTYKLSNSDPKGGTSTDDHTVGLHYFQKGHNARYGIEYRTGDSDDWTLVGVQFLL